MTLQKGRQKIRVQLTSITHRSPFLGLASTPSVTYPACLTTFLVSLNEYKRALHTCHIHRFRPITEMSSPVFSLLQARTGQGDGPGLANQLHHHHHAWFILSDFLRNTC